MRKSTLLLAVSAAILGGTQDGRAAPPGEAGLELAPDAQLPLVRARCSICHSVDYIEMNSPFLGRAAWESEVRKMMKAFGAPVGDAEVDPIVDYLSRHYGSKPG